MLQLIFKGYNGITCCAGVAGKTSVKYSGFYMRSFF